MSVDKKIKRSREQIKIDNALALSKQLKAIKSLGYLKDVKPTKAKPLTKSQIKNITIKHTELKAVINSTQDNFQKINISKFQTDDKNALKRDGYLVVDDNVFIPKQGQAKVTLRKQYFKDDELGVRRNLIIHRTDKIGRISTDTPVHVTGIKEIDWQKRLEQEKRDLKLKKDEYFGLQFYTNGSFEAHILQDLQAGFKYLEEAFVPKHGDSKETLLDNIHVTKISVKDYRHIQGDLKEKDKQKKAKEAASKKARRTMKVTPLRKKLQGAVNKK